jgi:GDP-D-mannose 3', 5'-epimerase
VPPHERLRFPETRFRGPKHRRRTLAVTLKVGSPLVRAAAGAGNPVARLREAGRRVRAVDVRPVKQWYQVFGDVDNVLADLRLRESCERACTGVDRVFQLAADMGGMGFIEHNKALCMLSVLTNTHMLQGALHARASRFFFSSSACVYNA